MVSALWKINGQVLATQGTTGINVAGGSTITIQLSNTSGVSHWSINCTNSDGRNPLSAISLINATKIVDQVNYTATFTAPNLSVVDGYVVGAALQFTSIVNAGEWNQQTSSMGVFVLGPTGVRMVFNGETFESDATYGVSRDINDLNDQRIAPAATSTVPGLIQLTNDLGGTALLPNVVGIQGNPVQNGLLGAVQDGYVLSWNAGANEYEPKPPALILSTGKVYEFENTTSDIATYYVLDGIAGIEADLSVSINSGSGKTLIKSFATAVGSPNITYIPSGQWDFDFYSYVSITAGVTQFIFDVYIRTAGGTETLLFTTTSPEINFTTVTQSSLTYSFSSDTNINTTDRVVVKVSAITTSGGTVAAHFVFDGTNHASHFHTPIPGAASILGGDLSGNTGNAKVVSISGTSPIPIAPANLQFLSTTTNPKINQADLTTASGTGNSLTIQAQNETGTTSTGGALVLSSGTGTTKAGSISINAGATPEISIFPGAAGTEIDVGTVDGYVLLVGATIVNNIATTAVNADYTCDITGGGNWKDAVIICTFTSSHNIKLPNPVTYIGRKVVIKTTGSISTSVTCTIQRYGSENIEGLAANYVIMSPWTKMEFITDGTNWFII